MVIQLKPASIGLTVNLTEYFGDWDASLTIVGVSVLHLLHKDLQSELSILRGHTRAIKVVKDIIITLVFFVLLIWQHNLILYRYFDGGIPYRLVLVFLSG